MFRKQVRFLAVQSRRAVQLGLGLLEVLLFIAIISGLVLGGFSQWRSREAIQTAVSAKSVLAQADRALITFATVNHRLPCPDTNRDGLEDCAAGVQKGWLPSKTLALAGADPGVRNGQLRYLVQRGDAAYDLTVSADDWRPLSYDDSAYTFLAMQETAAGGGTYPSDIRTLADLCQRVEMGAAATLTPGMAQVKATPPRSVAYALVHPGRVNSDGGNSLFDLSNDLPGNVVEDPALAPVLSQYDDQVLERSFASLQADFGCQTLFQSINTVALARDVVDEVDGMRLDNIDAATRAVAFASLAIVMTGVEVASAILEAVSDSGNAAAEFAACVASLGIAVNFCSAAGIHVGSAITAGISTGLNIGVIGFNIAALVLAGNALILADKTATPASIPCPPIDLASSHDAAKKERDNANADLISTNSALTQAKSDLATSGVVKDAKTQALRDAVAAYGNSVKALAEALIASADVWKAKTATLREKELDKGKYQSAYDNQSSVVANYDTLLLNGPSQIAGIQADIALLKQQIAIADDPATFPPATDAHKQELARNLLKKQNDLALLSDTTRLQAERDKAAADQAAAATDLANATTAYNTAVSELATAKSNYQTAYANLYNATYDFGNGIIVPVPGVRDAMMSLYGHFNSAFDYSLGYPEPSANSIYLLTEKLQRKVDVITTQQKAAQDRATRAQSALDSIEQQMANPGTCGYSGTGVNPFGPAAAAQLLVDVDTKGGTR